MKSSTTSVCCSHHHHHHHHHHRQPLHAISSCSGAAGRIAKPSVLHRPPSPTTTAAATRLGVEPETEIEMLACLARLEELVPTAARYRTAALTTDEAAASAGHPADADDEFDSQQQQLSQVQLLQHVIDYILDLESTLDFRPDSTASVAQQPSPAHTVPLCRSGTRTSSVDDSTTTASSCDDEDDDDEAPAGNLISTSGCQRTSSIVPISGERTTNDDGVI